MNKDRSLEIAKMIVDAPGEYAGHLLTRAQELLAAAGIAVKKSKVSFASILGNEVKVIEKSERTTPGFAAPTSGGLVSTPSSYGLATPDPWLRGEENFAASSESGIADVAGFEAPKPGGLGQGSAAMIPTDKSELQYGAAEQYRHVGDEASASAIERAVGKTPKVDWPSGTPSHERKLKKLREGFGG